MSTELQAAAERLRRYAAGEDLRDIYDTRDQPADYPGVWTEMNAIGAAAVKLNPDMRIVVAAYLALVPADDSLGLDEAWLRSAACADGKTTFYFGDQLLVYISGDGHWCAIVGSDPRRVPYAAGGFRLKDRGQLRLLCRALRVPLTESPSAQEKT